MKIAAFRPENMVTRAKEIAARYNFDFFGFPVFQLVTRKDAVEEIEKAFASNVDIVVFTSLNGVQKTFRICDDAGFDLKAKLSAVEVCAIGPTTRDELQKRGVDVSLMPEEYSAKGLMELLTPRAATAAKIVLLRSAAGGKQLTEFLRTRGAYVVDIAVYEPRLIETESQRRRFVELIEYQPDYIIFTSSLTFKYFRELASKFRLEEDITALLRTAKVTAIGDLTAKTIAEAGISADIVAERSTFEDVVSEIKRNCNRRLGLNNRNTASS